MGEWETYILSAIFFAVFCVIFLLWKLRGKNKASTSAQKFIYDTLDLARSQFEIFNIKLVSGSGSRSGLSAMLHSVDKDGLRMEVGDYVPEEFKGSPVTVFFRARRDEGPVFYTFASRVEALKSDYVASSLLLKMPDHLQVEKKRHFIRVQPDKNDVRVIGVWPLLPGKKLPSTADEIGAPLTHYRPGMKDEQIQLENISGAGLAVRIFEDQNMEIPPQMAKGSQLLCLVVYSMDMEHKRDIAFWCTGEIMNVRREDGKKPSLILGIEFTNWAVLEQGQGEIHWAHSSPSRGVKPILQWVDNIDKKLRKHS